MKFKHLVLFPLLAFSLWSCSDDDNATVAGDGAGQIRASFKANYSIKAAASATESSLDEAIAPDIKNFMVHLWKSDNSYDKTWSSIEEFPVDTKFTTGSYEMEISYGDMNEEGFEKPYYYGSAKFNVEDEETANPEIEATLANTMVSIAYTDAFKQYFTDYSAKIHSAGGAYVDFVKDETRAAYVKPGKVSFLLSLTKSNGTELSLEPAAIDNAEAQTHYRVTFDVNGGEVGDAVLSITFDDSTIAEPIEISLSEELFNAPAPVVTMKGFDSSTPIDIIEGDEAVASVVLVAQSGLSSVMLTTSSEFLISKGWSAEMDLMAAAPDQQALLAQYGLKVTGLWKNPDKMAVIDFSDLIPNLQPLNGSSTHKFIIQVKDILGRTLEAPAELIVNAPAVIFTMSNPQKSEAGTNEGVFTLNFNGNMDNVSFKALNDYGTYVDAPIVSYVETADDTYTVTVKIPENESSTTIKGYYKGVEKAASVDVKIGLAYSLSVANVDVWATKAILSVNAKYASTKSTVVKNAKMYVKTTGDYVETSSVTRDEANGTITVSGLTPGVVNYVKTVVTEDDGSEAVAEIAFTTESAAQVANADMESWYIESKVKKADFIGSDKTYYTFHPYSSGETDIWWATNNDKAQGGTYALGIWYEGCFASCASYTTDVHGGSKAALIYVSGCGDSYANTASTYVGGAMVGSMWIGNFDNKTISQGHSFSSRPSSLSFWYKYAPYNSDAFKVVASLKSGDETIATGTYEPTAYSTADASYKQAVVNFNYTVTDKKATAICIQFLASNRTNVDSADYFATGTTITYPEIGNWTVHMGSVLKFDDLVLNY